MVKTPELAVFQAQKETELFADRMGQMFAQVRELYGLTDAEAFAKKYDHIRDMEQMSDRLESEIGGYLGQVGNAHLSDDTKRKVRSMLRAVSELESIGDSCFNLARILERKLTQKAAFTPLQDDGVLRMFALVAKALDNMSLVLKGEGDVDVSFALENEIDALRTSLRAQNTVDVDEGKYSFAVGTIYIDLVRECEKCGDYVKNVVESKRGKRDNRTGLDALKLDADTKAVTIDGKPVDFSGKEFEILSLLVSNPGRVFSQEEILEILWPKDVNESTRVVDDNLRRIRTKLGDLSGHLVYRSGDGYLFE